MEIILSLVFTTEDDLISNLSIGECLRESDHMFRFNLDIPLLKKENTEHKRLDLKPVNFE